jgi:hypothetical protein
MKGINSSAEVSFANGVPVMAIDSFEKDNMENILDLLNDDFERMIP